MQMSSLFQLFKFVTYTSAKNARSITSSSFQELTLDLKRKIEKEWSSEVSGGTFRPGGNQCDKMYVLSMFPYPSGNLHLGHVRVYTIGDAMARFHRLRGKNVFHPIGFDAFGLPAENAALERKVSANAWTRTNIECMRKQLKSLNLSFDWDHEIITCDESYYKWTQYLFGLLFKAGLVYQQEAMVNWDPVDGTVLADEQVDFRGLSWRSGCKVQRKLLKQWFIETTSFALPLYNGLDSPQLQNWRDIIKIQKHWIGECTGYAFKFPVLENGVPVSSLKIWTRYPEMMQHASFLAVRSGSVLESKFTSKDKSIKVLNPLCDKTLPVILNDEIEYDEGCDCKLIVPGLDKVSAEFVNRLGLDWREVGLHLDEEERKQICEAARVAGLGGYKVSSKLKDWLISRQRRWGTPIPVVHCPACGPVLVPPHQLPVPRQPHKHLSLWAQTECPTCHHPATRELDTMDTFVDSSWYYLRYADPRNRQQPFSEESKAMMPVNLYIGGKEHAVLHLYYARFMSHFLHSIKMIDCAEPFSKLLVQGMVMGRTFRLKHSGKFVPPDRVELKEAKMVEKSSSEEVEESWEKMSKSKHNGVEPEEVLNEYGIDTTRLLILSDVAPTSNKYWRPDSFPGTLNWQKRVWALIADFVESKNFNSHDPKIDLEKYELSLRETRNYYTRAVTFNYSESQQLSVAVAKLQGLTNSLKKVPKSVMGISVEFERCLGCLLVMMAPLVPHFASHLWALASSASASPLWSTPVLHQPWPSLDHFYPLPLYISVNGAVKQSLKLPYGDFLSLTPHLAHQMALNSEKVKNFIGACEILSTDLSITPSYEATFNITIDHIQRANLLRLGK